MSDRGEREEHEEYAGWDRPGADETAAGVEGRSVDAGGNEPGDEDGKGGETISAIREPLLRERLRERFGVTPRRWYVIETLLLAAPYALFVFVYLSFDVPETPFIVLTLLYSLVAIYVGMLP